MEEKIIDVELAGMVFGNNEEMYRKYLFQFVDRDLLGQVDEALAAGDVQKAFEMAHTMKGLVQNLALKKFSKVLEVIVEVMRDGSMPSEEQIRVVREEYDRTLEYIGSVRDNNISIFNS